MLGCRTKHGSAGRGRRRVRHGAAIVEFAVVLPMLLLVVFGIIEFGRVVMVQQILTNAAREGARAAVLVGSTDTEVRQVVSDYLTNARIGGTSTQIAPATTAVATGDPITVTVRVNYQSVSWLPGGSFTGLDGTELSASVTMRKE